MTSQSLLESIEVLGVLAQKPGDDDGPLSGIVTYGGWLLALVLLIWIGKQFFGKLIQEFATRFAAQFLRFFGSRVLGNRSIRNYRRALLRNYGKHPLGFRTDATVDVAQVYVPLQYVQDGHRLAIADALELSERAVVIGDPGAGKSLLMKRLMNEWASASQHGRTHTPVLVQLHGCKSGTSLNDAIFAEFERNGVHGRRGFVERALRDGQLLVLFDGLDEVARDDRSQVVGLIKDFVRTWDNCRYITTCRAAVYTGQLLPEFDTTVRIAPFDDAGIRQLLANWPGLSVDEADRFFAGLADSPQLMRLAGSPLLLTMMIYLYTDVFAKSGRTLPRSRPAFYEVAVDHLLRRDRDLARDDALSLFEGADKRAVLQHLALNLQESPQEQPDRLSIDRRQLIAIINGIRQDLNLRDDQVGPLISEIVERSQLLVPLDKQESRYAFRHLTLQEFLAAAELRGAPTRLMAYYRADRDSWRETVQLWCGVTSLDCADVVEELLLGDERDKLLALQCVAEATRIRDDLAQVVINHFIELLKADVPSSAVESALGAVASDDRPRGQSVFVRLRDQFLRGGPGHAGAARALALTRLPAAANTLGQRIGRDEHARIALRAMGEQAVPVLRNVAATGDLRSVDDLGEIGTASASAALSTLVWDESPTAFRASWWIAALIRRREVEDGLPTWLTRLDLAAPFFDWLWRPFGASGNVGPLMGRVALLLGKDVGNHRPAKVDFIDNRIGIPVVLLAEADGARSGVPEPRAISFDNLGQRFRRWLTDGPWLLAVSMGRATIRRYPARSFALAAIADEPDDPTLREYFNDTGTPSHIQRVLLQMAPQTRFAILTDMFSQPRHSFTIRRWLESKTPIEESRALKRAWAATIWVCAIAIVGVAAYQGYSPPLWERQTGPDWLALSNRFSVGIIAFAALLYYLSDVVRTSSFGLIDMLIDASDAILNFFEDLAGGIPAFVLLTLASLSCVAGTWTALVHWWGLNITITIVSIISIFLLTMVAAIARRTLIMVNPFRVIMNSSDEELTSRMNLYLARVGHMARN